MLLVDEIFFWDVIEGILKTLDIRLLGSAVLYNLIGDKKALDRKNGIQ